jgi:hypothetical protein
MSYRPLRKALLAGLALAPVLRAPSVLACAACFGKTDAPLAVAMNWGILSLLVVVGCVLSGVAAFGVFLAKRSSAIAAGTLPPQPPAGMQNETKKI